MRDACCDPSIRYEFTEIWKDAGVNRPTAILVSCSVLLLSIVPSAFGHGAGGNDFRTEILSVEPPGLPVDVRIVDGDQVRFENAGDQELVVCGYEREGCEEWVRIGPDGVFVDRNAKSYFANLDDTEYGDVPADAGEEPEWKRVRQGPPFYSYHDHRVHWMGLGVPPNVDQSSSEPQTVFDSELAFRYGDTDGVVKTRLEYIGGAPWLQRNAEQLIVGAGILAMLVVFLADARRRRRAHTGVVEVDGA